MCRFQNALVFGRWERVTRGPAVFVHGQVDGAQFSHLRRSAFICLICLLCSHFSHSTPGGIEPPERSKTQAATVMASKSLMS
jgi:hypothetical protein